MPEVTLKEVADFASTHTTIPSRFHCAWMYAENGPDVPPDFNFGNISYSGEGVPSGGVFQGVTGVQENRVCTYGTWQEGINAVIYELNIPKGPTKWLSIDIHDLQACNGNVEELAKVVGESNWASSHYQRTDAQGQPLPGTFPGQTILDAYHNTVIASWYEPSSEGQMSSPSATRVGLTPRPGQLVYTVTTGETLTIISDKYRVPIGVLARYNNIADVNEITVGQQLVIPSPIDVRMGDTVSNFATIYHQSVEFICTVNALENPNRILIGQVIWL